jgi:ion channel-forming bestrophin family protein
MAKKQWFRVALQLKGSVIPEILPRTLVCASFGVLISILYGYGFELLSLPILAGLIPNLVLGLLLVFRTNTAYERFWEGRKAWGMLMNTVRNLARQIWVAVQEKDSGDRANKIKAVRLILAFAIAMKLHLRHDSVSSELEAFVAPEQFEKLKTMNHPPLEIAFWISDYLQHQHERGCLNTHQLIAMNELLNFMIDALGACERIQTTPMPLAYSIHLKQLLLLYCLSLPFQMVQGLAWLTGPVVGLISFTLLGIEEIGIEIEDPFGRDPNDLPLDTICKNMQRNIDDLITLS